MHIYVLSPKNLTPTNRKDIVEYMTAEGCSAPEIELVVGLSVRQVCRLRASIREANAVGASPAFRDQMIGQLMMDTESCRAQMRKIARSADVEAAVKIEALKTCVTTLLKLTQALQRLGVLPTAATEIHGTLSCQERQPPSLDELAQQLSELEQLAVSIALPESMKEVLDKLKAELARQELAQRMAQARKRLTDEQSAA